MYFYIKKPDYNICGLYMRWYMLISVYSDMHWFMKTLTHTDTCSSWHIDISHAFISVDPAPQLYLCGSRYVVICRFWQWRMVFLGVRICLSGWPFSLSLTALSSLRAYSSPRVRMRLGPWRVTRQGLGSASSWVQRPAQPWRKNWRRSKNFTQWSQKINVGQCTDIRSEDMHSFWLINLLVNPKQSYIW